MTSIDFAIQAKSDQLNAVDLSGGDRIIKIRDVIVQQSDQPVSVYFDGDNNKPWKPSKGMLRVLAGCWGNESGDWIGKSAQIYMDDSVIYAGQAVGGIRIRALTDISKEGRKFPLAINKKKREQIFIACLSVSVPMYPEDKFSAAFDAMVEQIRAGKTVQQIVARCQKTGNLTGDQMARLEDAAKDLNTTQSFTPVQKPDDQPVSQSAGSDIQQNTQAQSIDEF